MLSENHYQNSILLLSFLLMNADGVLEDSETEAIGQICEHENIQRDTWSKFLNDVKGYTERQVYEMGIDEVSLLPDADKIKVFAWLHRISEADGNVHVKEVRFLLYSIKKAGIEFKDVLKYSANFPSLK